ncbi:MAG: thermonuclease family protein [Acidimicrobiales bacterium]
MAPAARAFVLVSALLLAACAHDTAPRVIAGPPAAGLPAGVDVAIERVVDGDTVVVTGKQTVRLIGVDAPETKDPRRPVGCFGQEASRFLTSTLPAGTAVRLVGDVEQHDRYGRLLAYLYRRDSGLFVNAELVRQGYASVLTIPPNVAHADEFVELAREARVDGRGLWEACP